MFYEIFLPIGLAILAGIIIAYSKKLSQNKFLGFMVKFITILIAISLWYLSFSIGFVGYTFAIIITFAIVYRLILKKDIYN